MEAIEKKVSAKTPTDPRMINSRPIQISVPGRSPGWAWLALLREVRAALVALQDRYSAAFRDRLEALGEEGLHMSKYMEVRCRNLHRMVEEYMNR